MSISGLELTRDPKSFVENGFVKNKDWSGTESEIFIKSIYNPTDFVPCFVLVCKTDFFITKDSISFKFLFKLIYSFNITL